MGKKQSTLSRRSFMGMSIAAGGAIMATPSLLAAKVMPKGVEFDKTADVIVLGAGVAGAAAAAAAVDAGARVIQLEAFKMTGGNTALSTGWVNVCNSPMQQKKGIKDSVESFYKDSMALSGNRRNPELTRVVAEQGAATVNWLMARGVKFKDDVEPAMGSPKPRCIQVDGYGGGLTRSLQKYAQQKGVETLTETRALNLYRESYGGENKIVGVEAESKGKTLRFGAAAVIIATGGFSYNKQLVSRYNAKLGECLPTGYPTIQGDGLIMALKEGADAVNLGEMLICPTKEVKSKAYMTSGALTGGGILVNEKGLRFIDELKGYTPVSLSCLEQQKVFEIMVEKCHSKVTDFIRKGIVQKADSIGQLAANIGVDKTNLEKELKDFNEATMGKIKDKYGRQVFREKLEAPFYSMQIAPTLILCKGGLVIDTRARVLNISGEPVLKGLYAAGEVTAGYIEYGYRTGDSLSFSAVFGKIAGENAVA